MLAFAVCRYVVTRLRSMFFVTAANIISRRHRHYAVTLSRDDIASEQSAYDRMAAFALPLRRRC